MTSIEFLQGELSAAREFFDRSTSIFEEKDSSFAPVAGMFTVAQQVAHVAQTIDWFFEGALRPEGFSTDWEALEKGVRRVTSLAEARAWFHRATDAALAKLGSIPVSEWEKPLPAGPIMGGAPRHHIVGAIADHSAHHRGALTVYARLLGKASPMPYM